MSEGQSSSVQATDTETTQEHRLKEIHESKRRCEEVVFSYKSGQADGDTLQAAVEQYILSVYPLLREHGRDYLTEKHIGSMKIKRNCPSSATNIDDFSQDFYGLATVLNVDSVAVERIVERSGRGAGYKRETKQYRLASNILVNAYMLTSEFVQQIGLGIELEEDNGPMQI